MGIKRLVQCDAETGETLDHGFVAYVVPKRRNGFGGSWVAMGQDAALILAQQVRSADDLRVALALIARLDFENLLVVNQAELADQLGMQRQNVQRSIKRLIELGMLLRGPRIGVSRSYRLNPNFGWKGSAKGHVVALDAYRRGEW